jgi:hypothetical protein
MLFVMTTFADTCEYKRFISKPYSSSMFSFATPPDGDKILSGEINYII